VEAVKFSQDHLWVRVDGHQARIGLSEHGQNALGEVKAVELPEIGDPVERGEAFGELESRRTVTELLSPVSGTVTAINIELEDSPSLVNDDPHHDGWLVEVELSDPAELDDLMSSEQYEALVAEEA
jgi:glycine cleavage system H protein